MSLLKLTNQKHHSKEIEVDSNIRICYFTVNTNKGVGYVCMAVNRPDKGSDSKHYTAGFSSYSPLDEKSFSKTHARNSAIGRIIKFRPIRKDVRGEVCKTNPRLEFDYETNGDEKFNLKDVFERGLQLAMQNMSVPGWVARGKVIYGLDPQEEKLVSKKI
jgi:hypothetical protein